MIKRVVRKSQGGFTLVELMIVVVIIGILAMVAVPAYNDSIKKGRRADAKSMLATIAARQEQYFMDNKQYADGLNDLGFGTAAESASIDGHYTVRIDAGTLTTTYFKAEAQPVAEDSQCQQLTLDAAGVRGVAAGDSPVTAAPTWSTDQCW